MCHAGALDNPVRRRWAPAEREVRILGPRPGDVVADLGTGVGFVLPELLKAVGAQGRVYAADIDAENLTIARDRVHGDPRVTFIEGSAAAVPGIPDASVDRVLLNLVLCCAVDKKGVLHESWRVLKPGGVLLATYPLPLRLRRRSLAVTKPVWDELVRALPWEVLPVQSRWWFRRRMLRRPL